MIKQTKLGKLVLFCTLFLSTACLFFANIAIGQEDTLKVRQANMEKIDDALNLLARMNRGSIDYDAVVAMQAVTVIRDEMLIFIENFPDGSDQGLTEASPKIWEDMEGFIAANKKLIKVANDAIPVVGEGHESLKVSFDKIEANCESCHDDYLNKNNLLTRIWNFFRY